MSVMFIVGVLIATPAEQAGNPLVAAQGVDIQASALQSGGNMEGKETASASPPARSSRSSPPPHPAARSTRCTTASPPSAAPCRW
ncbi:potassium-transporting ATPase potassium-binding subunit [Ditylenchus destructor]|nr:potassium-transporting ATPase potassium-binding subunit [Ditylenchus destructor]